jgi:hypothetical protein
MKTKELKIDPAVAVLPRPFTASSPHRTARIGMWIAAGCWLKRQAKAKNFSLTSIVGPATTAEAVRSMQSIHDHAEPPEAA